MDRRLRGKRQRYAAEVYDYAEELLSAPVRPTGRAIAEALEERFGDAAPMEKTVRAWIRDERIRRTEPGESWRVQPVEPRPEDAAYLLAVLREVIVDRSHVGEVATIPSDLARWIVALREPLQGLTPLQVHDVARLYAARVANDRPTSDVDVWMAFRPWRMSVEDLEDWKHRVADFNTYSMKRPPLHFLYADPYSDQEATDVPE
jgi:hypothetical protein